jgi:FkbM family methyltransferase
MLAERFEQVVAFEPAVESYQHLVEYVPENVRPLNIAVSATTGPLTLRETTLTSALGELFTDDTLPWGGHVGYRDVGAMTLDELAEMYGYPDFIKVDTEGHEVEVLRGGGEVFSKDPAFIIECHSSQKGEQVKHFLSTYDLPYDIYHHEAYRRSSPTRLKHYWVTSPRERLT